MQKVEKPFLEQMKLMKSKPDELAQVKEDKVPTQV